MANPGDPDARVARTCTECGWRTGDSPGLRLGSLAWARIGAFLLTLGIVGLLWFTIAQRSRIEGPAPLRVFRPALSLTDLRAIAGGTADAATIATFVDQMRSLCAEGMARDDADEQVLGFGFIAVPFSIERRGFGWPESWWWRERTTAFADAIHRDGPHPFVSGPAPLPAPISSFVAAPTPAPWVVPSGPRWTFDLRGVTFQPPPEETGGQRVRWGFSIAQLGIPIGATWIACWLTVVGARARRAGWIALLASIVLWAALGIGLNRERDEVSGAWRPWGSGWVEASPLRSSIDDTLAALDEPGGRGAARVAQAIVWSAYKEGSPPDDALNLCGVVTGAAPRTLQGFVVGGTSGLFSFERTTNAPRDARRTPTKSGPQWRFDHGAIELRLRPVLATEPEKRLRLELGPLFLLLALLAAIWWSAAVIQRRVQAARRARRDCCPRCGYPFATCSAPLTNAR